MAFYKFSGFTLVPSNSDFVALVVMLEFLFGDNLELYLEQVKNKVLNTGIDLQMNRYNHSPVLITSYEKHNFSSELVNFKYDSCSLEFSVNPTRWNKYYNIRDKHSPNSKALSKLSYWTLMLDAYRILKNKKKLEL